MSAATTDVRGAFTQLVIACERQYFANLAKAAAAPSGSEARLGLERELAALTELVDLLETAVEVAVSRAVGPGS